MKFEEAIRTLHPDTSANEIAEIKYKYGFRGDEQAVHKIEKACKIACKATEKQIPKKLPVVEELYHCPHCGEKDAVLQGDNYCFNYGQALDWSDEK